MYFLATPQNSFAAKVPFLPVIGMTHSNPVSTTVPDWSREKIERGCWQPSRYLLRSIRGYQAARARGGLSSLIVRRFWVLSHRFWGAVNGADIPINTRIAGGLSIPHANGIVIHSDSVIGPNCLISQQVTLGGGSLAAPRLGVHVRIDPGAKVLGNVTIGDHAIIHANSVVLSDIPSHATAEGIPAKILHKK